MQSWEETKSCSNKACFYKIFKHNFGFEKYLDILPFKQRVLLTKFRVSNHNLPVETGRWEGLSRDQRKCPTCPNIVLGDEFHYLFECPSFNRERNIHVKRYFTQHPNAYKTYQLFNSENKLILSQLTNFINKINSKF